MCKHIFCFQDLNGIRFIARRFDAALTARLCCILPSLIHQIFQIIILLTNDKGAMHFFVSLTGPARDLLTYIHILECCWFHIPFDGLLLSHFFLRFLKSAYRAYNLHHIAETSIFYVLGFVNCLLIVPKFAKNLIAAFEKEYEHCDRESIKELYREIPLLAFALFVTVMHEDVIHLYLTDPHGYHTHRSFKVFTVLCYTEVDFFAIIFFTTVTHGGTYRALFRRKSRAPTSIIMWITFFVMFTLQFVKHAFESEFESQVIYYMEFLVPALSIIFRICAAVHFNHHYFRRKFDDDYGVKEITLSAL